MLREAILGEASNELGTFALTQGDRNDDDEGTDTVSLRDMIDYRPYNGARETKAVPVKMATCARLGIGRPETDELVLLEPPASDELDARAAAAPAAARRALAATLDRARALLRGGGAAGGGRLRLRAIDGRVVMRLDEARRVADAKAAEGARRRAPGDAAAGARAVPLVLTFHRDQAREHDLRSEREAEGAIQRGDRNSV